MKARFGFAAVAGLGLMMVGGSAMADQIVDLTTNASGNITAQTNVTTVVDEQATVTVPSAPTMAKWYVAAGAVNTPGDTDVFSVSNVVLTYGHKLSIQVKSDRASFTDGSGASHNSGIPVSLLSVLGDLYIGGTKAGDGGEAAITSMSTSYQTMFTTANDHPDDFAIKNIKYTIAPYKNDSTKSQQVNAMSDACVMLVWEVTSA